MKPTNRHCLLPANVLLVLTANLFALSSSFLLDELKGGCFQGSTECQCDVDNMYDARYFTARCWNKHLTQYPDFRTSISAHLLNDYPAWSVDLQGNNLTVLPAGGLSAFANAKYFVLEVFDNQITHVENDAFRGLENSAFVLDLGLNFLTSLPQALLSLRNLTTLYINHNPLKTLDASILRHISPTLVEFQISLDSVSQQLGSSQIMELPLLEYFTVWGLQQWILPSKSVKLFSSVRDIFIDKTDIVSVPCSFLDNPSIETVTIMRALNFSNINLIDFSCAMNNFTSSIHGFALTTASLPEFPDILGYTPDLEVLNLYDNLISSVNEAYIPASNKLYKLILSQNCLTTIPKSFLRFTELRQLYIQDNHIATVTSDTLNQFSNFNELCFQGNSVNITLQDVKSCPLLFPEALRQNVIVNDSSYMISNDGYDFSKRRC